MNGADSTGRIRLKWLGCACFEMRFGDLTVVNDPWITPNERNGLTWEAVEACDLITLTHSHYDHTLDIPALARKFSPYVLCGEQSAPALMRFADLNPMDVYPLSPGLELDFGAVRIRAVYGRHTPLPGTMNERIRKAETSPVNRGDPNLIEMAVWGDIEYRNYLFILPDGRKMLLWGNRLDRPDQKATVKSLKPDILLLQMTGKVTAEQIAEVCRAGGIRTVIPHHIDFPGDYRPLAVIISRELKSRCPEINFIFPEYGEWLEV